jgi:hypothetical protein
MSEVQREFLERLRDGKRLAFATRIEDRARQKCRRLGYATVVMNPRRWVITEAGLAALAAPVFEGDA